MKIYKMTRRQIALHSLQAEFMEHADPSEWYLLPGGTHLGRRIPDMADDDLPFTMVGCWFTKPAPDHETAHTTAHDHPQKPS